MAPVALSRGRSVRVTPAARAALEAAQLDASVAGVARLLPPRVSRAQFVGLFGGLGALFDALCVPDVPREAAVALLTPLVGGSKSRKVEELLGPLADPALDRKTLAGVLEALLVSVLFFASPSVPAEERLAWARETAADDVTDLFFSVDEDVDLEGFVAWRNAGGRMPWLRLICVSRWADAPPGPAYPVVDEAASAGMRRLALTHLSVGRAVAAVGAEEPFDADSFAALHASLGGKGGARELFARLPGDGDPRAVACALAVLADGSKSAKLDAVVHDVFGGRLLRAELRLCFAALLAPVLAVAGGELAATLDLPPGAGPFDFAALSRWFNEGGGGRWLALIDLAKWPGMPSTVLFSFPLCGGRLQIRRAHVDNLRGLLEDPSPLVPHGEAALALLAPGSRSQKLRRLRELEGVLAALLVVADQPVPAPADLSALVPADYWADDLVAWFAERGFEEAPWLELLDLEWWGVEASAPLAAGVALPLAAAARLDTGGLVRLEALRLLTLDAPLAEQACGIHDERYLRRLEAALQPRRAAELAAALAPWAAASLAAKLALVGSADELRAVLLGLLCLRSDVSDADVVALEEYAELVFAECGGSQELLAWCRVRRPPWLELLARVGPQLPVSAVLDLDLSGHGGGGFSRADAAALLPMMPPPEVDAVWEQLEEPVRPRDMAGAALLLHCRGSPADKVHALFRLHGGAVRAADFARLARVMLVAVGSSMPVGELVREVALGVEVVTAEHVMESGAWRSLI